MAKQNYLDCDKLCRTLVSEASKGIFRPVYLLMGDEPYYVDMVCDAVMDNCIPEEDRDFNQLVCYGSDTNADKVITAARRYPMFSERQLVVLKEAQMMKDVENLHYYCETPLDSTVLVICMKGARADKRRALYKSASRFGAVVDSVPVREYEMAGWLQSYFSSRGLRLAPDAAQLLIEFAGMELSKIAIETDKMLRNLPEGTVDVSAEDVETNVGMSRKWTIFELSEALFHHDAAKALRIASLVGSSAGFAMPAATGRLFAQFYNLLRYHAVKLKKPGIDSYNMASELGISPYLLRNYETAARWYNLKKTMQIVALFREYDFKGKGGEQGEASQGDLLVELTAKILA